MADDMGTFRVDMELENPANPGVKRTLRSVLVDTGAELSWGPAEVLESLGVERGGFCRRIHLSVSHKQILRYARVPRASLRMTASLLC